MRAISYCLNPQLINICQRAVQLGELTLRVNRNLPSALAEHCQVGSFNHGCLLITLTNPAWATELRYHLPELRDKLRQSGLYQLTSIKIAILEPQAPKLLQKQSKNISSTKAYESMRSASELCTYPPLKKALLQLAAQFEAGNSSK